MDGKAAAAVRRRSYKPSYMLLEGFRAFRIRTSVDEERILKWLYSVVTRLILHEKEGRPVEKELEELKSKLPKSLFWYDDEWYREYEVVKESSEKAKQKRKGKKGKRRRRKRMRLPPLPLLVCFVEGGRKYGNTAAAFRVLLDKGVLSVGCLGLKIRLQPNLIRTLKEELRLHPPPKFTIFLTCKGKLRLIARRVAPAWWWRMEESDDPLLVPPARIISVDINSRNGCTIMAFDIHAGEVERVYQARPKPNHGREWRAIRLLDSYIAKPSSEKLRKLLQVLPKGLADVLRKNPTPSKAKEIRRELFWGRKKNNAVWIRKKVLNPIRKLVREVPQGWTVMILDDPPDPDSLRNSSLQRTLLRVRRYIENLAAYEGVYYREMNISGKRCPLCDNPGVEVPVDDPKLEERYYRCVKCEIIYNRDYCANARLMIRYAPEIREWLRKHPAVLAPNLNTG